MNWYLGKLVFRIICGEGQHTPQFDEQLRLISAANEEVAFAKAVILGEREQEGFYNQEQKLVQWKFINVAELYKLSGLLDGAELYSRIQETDNPNLYIELTNKKAAHIRLNTTHKFLELL
ncbi:MAG: DUF4288 domain-containing protein [Bacteroidota bacterium]|nr:DUF4288 domain-containing protein [Bacteroidota bacterium]MDP4253193.1 DUF4288 domain-containing protein [Bacteroidota bacterium]MDP4259356.1 DUF4288 domain-containing protein [Bacteroidota bacterium]